MSFRQQNQAKHKEWFNGAVPSFGDPNARLVIVGLAPGLKGANRTGRPFTGDFAGDLLYSSLLKFGFAKGDYSASSDDSLTLVNCLITNAVRCVPPENKPRGIETQTCRQFLEPILFKSPKATAILTLGRVAHDSTVRALGMRIRDVPFRHGARHDIEGGSRLYDSYHCSRYNTNTGRLTTEMFHDVLRAIRDDLP